MSERDDGGPAFPEVFTDEEWSEVNMNYKRDVYSAGGMTLRDYFAGRALPECIIVAAEKTPGDAPNLSEMFNKAAGYAYYAADAMLAARKAAP